VEFILFFCMTYSASFKLSKAKKSKSILHDFYLNQGISYSTKIWLKNSPVKRNTKLLNLAFA
jgi:hypothetical protein